MNAHINDLRFDAADGKICRQVAALVSAPNNGDDRLDADQAVLFGREVEIQIAAEVEIDRPEYMLADGDLLQLDEVPDGVIDWYQNMVDGRALVAWGRCGNMPYASLGRTEIRGKLENYLGGYKWCTEDERRASFAGLRLVPLLQDASVEAHVRRWDEVIAWGREVIGLNGLFNHPNITVVPTVDGVSGFGDWPRKTADEILNDVNLLVNAIPQATNELRSANTVLMSHDMFRYITQTRLGPGDGSDKIFELIQSAHRGVTFRPVRYLSRANDRSQGNLPTGDAMFAFNNDRRFVTKIRAFLARFLAPQRKGLDTIVPGESKVGGVKILEPLTMARMDGLFLS